MFPLNERWERKIPKSLFGSSPFKVPLQFLGEYFEPMSSHACRKTYKADESRGLSAGSIPSAVKV